jgi:hypothetical protein
MLNRIDAHLIGTSGTLCDLNRLFSPPNEGSICRSSLLASLVPAGKLLRLKRSSTPLTVGFITTEYHIHESHSVRVEVGEGNA